LKICVFDRFDVSDLVALLEAEEKAGKKRREQSYGLRAVRSYDDDGLLRF
jgi:hypothetical protein